MRKQRKLNLKIEIDDSISIENLNKRSEENVKMSDNIKEVDKTVEVVCNEYIISLDAGKFMVKALGRDANAPDGTELKKVSLRTKSYDTSRGSIELEGNSHLVEFDGQAIVVGDQGVDSDFETSKANKLHQLCAYAAVTEYLEPNTKNNKIYMVLACPISVVKIPEAKQEYIDLIKGNGLISLKVDGNNYEFEIVDLIVRSEGSGITISNPELFRGKETVIVDFGGLNLGVSVYKNGVSGPEDKFIEEFAGFKLKEYIREGIRKYKKGNDARPVELEQAFEYGHLFKGPTSDDASIPFIKEAKKLFYEDAEKKIAEHGIKLETYPSLVYVGGTSEKITDQIKNVHGYAHIEPEAQWATVKGLYRVAYARYIKTRK